MSSRTGDQIDFTIYHCETPFVGMGSCADALALVDLPRELA